MLNRPNSKKVLLLTYVFSPLQAAESFLSAKALSKINSYTVDVLTLDYDNIDIAIDDSLSNYIQKGFGKIYRVKTPSFINAKVFSFLRYVSFFPDRFSFFNKYMFKEAVNINVDNYDAIISWSQWHSIHLVAFKIKKKFPSLPWMAHFSDPWSSNPFLSRFFGYKLLQYPLERKVIKYADSINFTTDLTRKITMDSYPKKWINKTYVTPHSYDPSLYGRANTESNDKLIVSYFGNFYGPRNPINFLKAVENIHNNNCEPLKGVVFQFTGKWFDNPNWHLGDINLPKGVVKIEDPVSYIESLNRMMSSDILLVLDASFDKSVFFPSKLVDYIGANKLILAFTPEGSCAEIVREVGGFVHSPESVQSIENGIISTINNFKSGLFLAASSNNTDQFSVDFVNSQFEVMFDQLAQK